MEQLVEPVVPVVVEINLVDLDPVFVLATVEEVVAQVEPEPEAALIEAEAEVDPSSH